MIDGIDFKKFVQSDDAADIEKRWERGDYDSLSKADWYREVEKRAAQIKKVGESDPVAFTRAITSDDLGRILFRAYQQADARAFHKRIFDEPVEKAVDPTPHIGPTHREMDVLATDRQRATGKSYQQSYAYVYSHGDNAALREKVKSEFLARAMHMGAGGSDIDSGTELGGPGSMTLTEAQALEPAPAFPRYARGV
jgi:hypothetical protein